MVSLETYRRSFMTRGKFIVIDGLGKSGKGSAISKLKQNFSDDQVTFTREPGGTPLSEKIRELILPEHGKELKALIPFPLFWAARRAHIEEKIIPALESGKHVICDRFDSSTYAYQIWGKENYRLRPLFDLMKEEFVNQDARPDLYIFFDVAPEEAIRRHRAHRVDKEIEDIFDERTIDFYQRTRRGFLEFMSTVNHKTVDTNRPFDCWFPESLAIINSTLA